MARMLIGLVAVSWMSRRTPEVTDAAWLSDARGLATDLGLRNVRFLRGAAGTMPMAWGIVRSSVPRGSTPRGAQARRSASSPAFPSA